MGSGYTETPSNWNEISSYIETDVKLFISNIFEKDKLFFYDTCSFRRHSNLSKNAAKKILEYMKNKNSTIIITRCILMELASGSGELNKEYINFIKLIRECDIDLFVVYEEDFFDVMSICYGTSTINELLIWTVRMLKGPISTITKVLNENERLNNEIIKGRNVDNKGKYKSFFSELRANKEAGDNLGEETIAICVHILSQLGEEDGKICIITDDKGAAGKIDDLLKQTAKQFRGSKIVIYSTPKLTQSLYIERIVEDREFILELISAGTDGNITVLATQIYDLRSSVKSFSSSELTDLIMTQNINITF